MTSTPDKRLLFLLFSYTVIAVILDYTFPLPKREWLAGVMTLGHWFCAFLLMFLLAYSTLPESFREIDDCVKKHQRKLVVVGVIVTAVMLAVSIRVGGDIRSPYASFLSSFPIFFMVLLFDSVTLPACLKGAGIAICSLVVIYGIDWALIAVQGQGLAIADEKLKAFLDSPEAVKLAVAILSITAVSNLLSLYFGSLKEADEKSAAGQQAK